MGDGHAGYFGGPRVGRGGGGILDLVRTRVGPVFFPPLNRTKDTS